MERKNIKKENYILGIIGAILGGLILLVPFAFGYIHFTGLYLLIITAFIPIFEFYGYKLFRGKIDKKLPIILLIITIINILIMSLILFPIALLVKAGGAVNIGLIPNIFKNNKLLFSIVQDGLVSLVLSLLGIYIISIIVNRKILLKVSNINLFSSDNKERQELKEEAIKTLKPVFEKYSATEKLKTIEKEEILADIKNDKAKEYFKYLKQLKIIKKYKGKYYYNLDNEKNINSHYLSAKIISSTCVAVAICAIIIFATSNMIGNNKKKVYNNDVSFSIDVSWIGLNSEEIGWIYYKDLDSEKAQEGKPITPATIGIVYEKTVAEGVSSINDIKSTIELYINSSPNYGAYNLEVFMTKHGYEAMELITSDETQVEVDYYIYKNGKIAYVTAITYTQEDEKLEELREYAKEVVNSFKWNK